MNRKLTALAYTLGPWTVQDAIDIYLSNDCVISADGSGDTCDESAANACLIAAAPELLEALTLLYEETAAYAAINNLHGVFNNLNMKRARDAISKAKGE